MHQLRCYNSNAFVCKGADASKSDPDRPGDVLVHEIGHHFGLSDADMAAVEAAADDSG